MSKLLRIACKSKLLMSRMDYFSYESCDREWGVNGLFHCKQKTLIANDQCFGEVYNMFNTAISHRND